MDMLENVKKIQGERLRVENILKVFRPKAFMELCCFQSKVNRRIAERMWKMKERISNG